MDDKKVKKDDNKRDKKEKYDLRADGSLIIKKKKSGKKEGKMSFTEYAKNKKWKDSYAEGRKKQSKNGTSQ